MFLCLNCSLQENAICEPLAFIKFPSTALLRCTISHIGRIAVSQLHKVSQIFNMYDSTELGKDRAFFSNSLVARIGSNSKYLGEFTEFIQIGCL